MQDYTTDKVCKSCKEHWRRAGEPPKTLLRLPQVSKRYGTTMYVCPWCDGPVFEVAVAAAKRLENDPDS